MGFFNWLFGSSVQSDLRGVGDDDALRGYTRDEVNTAALRLIHGEAPRCSPSWIGGTVEQADYALARIQPLRDKYAQYEPARMRREIMGWIDYFEREIRKNRADCVSQKSRRELDEHRSVRQQENERVRSLMERLDKP